MPAALRVLPGADTFPTEPIPVIDGEVLALDATRRIPVVPLLPPVPAPAGRVRLTRRGRIAARVAGVVAAAAVVLFARELVRGYCYLVLTAGDLLTGLFR